MSLTYVEPPHHSTRLPAFVKCLLVIPTIIFALYMFVVSLVLGPLILLGLYLFKRDVVTSALTPASLESIEKNPRYRDAALLERVWKHPVGQQYLSGSLEFQFREGYCAPTTLRNVLKSIPTIPSDKIPSAKAGPSTASQYQVKIDAIGYTKSTIVYGSEGYAAFLEAIKLANNPQYRVALNFLHAALFGMGGPKYLPHVALGAILGGHFSNIVGYLEDVDMVAVFDVNEDFGPYLVDSKRLYSAVRASDVQSGRTRALIVSQILDSSVQA
ncbi:unnamed protein product [Aphanomyces euteiches]|uniref:glutathione gamma-glutamylcysteinyltransferase n=1 Tax=Aphanomyces euteiches TaxID=100861 RepID=A0A6G0XW45_9STRA|nr:hypothetical protein Ae201684_001174 [Aphanomyces euteiches]KAH9099518.1 hypothetical protein Ae201684P_018531 [Aphanomyces euteiches]KAH9156244.1 hypothetical protein AeRB84_001827 [Aphanomyces euteiches]